MNIETTLILLGLLNFVILVLFFIMVKNVSRIRKKLDRSLEEFIQDADMEMYAGNKVKAKEMYLKAKYRIEVLKESVCRFDTSSIPGASIPELDCKIEEASK